MKCSDSKASAATYRRRLNEFIVRIREDVGVPDLPVVVGEVFRISSLANLANMTISGTGIATGTHISAIEDSNGNITLSS